LQLICAADVSTSQGKDSNVKAPLPNLPLLRKGREKWKSRGRCARAQQQLGAAERTLEAVIARYPGRDVARTASERLGALQLQRLC